MAWLPHFSVAKAIAPAALPAKKALFLLKLLGVTLCLPLCGKRALFSALCALPTLSLSLVSNRSSMLTFMFHYQDMATAFLLISMIYGYQWLQAHIGEGRPRLWKRGVALVMIGYAVACIATPRFQNPIRIMQKIVFDERFKDWHSLNHDIRVFENVPEDVSLYVQSGLGPRLALHPRRFLVYNPSLSLADPGKSLFVLSPLAGSYQLAGGYKRGVLLAEANPRLHLLASNGRLRVYASDGFFKRGAWFGGSCPKGNRVGAGGGVGAGRFGLGGRTGESKEGQVG